MTLDPNFLEKLIVKAMMMDKHYLVLISSVFEPEYFDDPAVAEIFTYAKSHLEENSAIPSKDIVINSTNENLREDIVEIFRDAEATDFDVARNYDYLLTQTNEYLKEQAIKRAIIEAVDIIDKQGEKELIRSKIEDALCKDLKVDLGLHYFRELRDRLRRIFTATDTRVPTFFPQMDEYINGGFPPYTLSVIVARIHGGKTNTICNMAARQVLHGITPVIMTLEMSQDPYAQRFDSIYSLLDINRMYLNSHKSTLVDRLAAVKATQDRGELYIKQFPTGEATVRDFRVYLRELLMRDINPDIIYVDYINLMKSADVAGKDLYSKVKRIAEELRALSFEFKVPVVSVSQLNREGTFVGLEELDFNYIAESLGLPATADFMMIYGIDEDSLIYESELHSKIAKNRLGGRVGEIIKFYQDARNLKMYDETEIQLWLDEAAESGDTRDLAEVRAQPTEDTTTRRRRTRR
jgi:replicative DNA helicase